MSKPVKHRPENAKQRDAFEEFVRTGANAGDENFGKIAEKFRVTRRTIEYWSSWYNWRSRAIQRELAIRPEIEKQTNMEVADARAQMLSEVDEALIMTRYGLRNAAKVEDGQLKGLDIIPTTARDWNMMAGSMEKLQRLKLHLLGEPEMSGEVKGDFIFRIVGVDPDSFPEQDDE